MTKEKRYEILDSLPTYGSMYIPISKDGEPFYSEGFVVRFYKSDNSEWVANFQPGWSNLKEVIEIKNSNNLLVIAGGTCYLMNPEHTKPIDVFGFNYIDLLAANNDRIVLYNDTHLTIFESNQKHWDSVRISWDGLAEIIMKENIVTGLSYDPMYENDEWVPFTYNIDERTLKGGSYERYKFKNIKPWWKFW